MIIGTLLGGATSGLQSLQAKIGRLREEQEVDLRLPSALPPVHHTAAGSLPVSTSTSAVSGNDKMGEHGLVDRQMEQGEKRMEVPIDETRAPVGQIGEAEGGRSWLSWIPGWGK